MHHFKWIELINSSIYLSFKVSLTTLAKNKSLPYALLSFAVPIFSPLLKRILYAVIYFLHFNMA